MPKKTNSIKIPTTILVLAKILEFFSTKWATLFAVKLFTTPVKYKMPNREIEMDNNTSQKLLNVPEINKQIMLYEYGNGSKKALLVHGWAGRGTQLYKIASELVKNDYQVISFDAPAHGKSSGCKTIMVEFIASILEIQKIYGTFDIAVGHSLGGMALINSVNKNLKISKLVTIGAGNSVIDIIDDFIYKLQMKPIQTTLLKNYFEQKYNRTLDELSSVTNARKIEIPYLIIHDENDDEVSVHCAYEIKKVLKNSSLMITQKLGHRKILGSNDVLAKIIDFEKIEKI
ncbi:MAG: alpha/beta fold hydrolase [Flavobacterium sp.]|nr:alpha/beta fold hydrolase [Flavobacterium sp.]